MVFSFQDLPYVCQGASWSFMFLYVQFIRGQDTYDEVYSEMILQAENNLILEN